MNMKLTQYVLRSGTEYITCWLESDRVKMGDLVSLKDTDEPHRFWEVFKVYATVDAERINRGFKNNI